MTSRLGPQRRLKTRKAIGLGTGPRAGGVDWSLVTDAELDRLEVLAMQTETFPTKRVFRTALAPEDRVWINVIGGRFGVALAVGRAVA